MQSKRLVLGVLVVLALLINSFFILQVKNSVSEEEYTTLSSSTHESVVVTSTRNKYEDADEYVLNVTRTNEPTSTWVQFNRDMVIEKENANPHTFNYLINPGFKVCGENQGADVLLLAFVPVSVGNFASRILIRQTWAHPSVLPSNYSANSTLKVVFILGTSKNATLTQELQFESELYGDIIQEDFIDAYQNLTIKTIMGLRWVGNYCSKAKFAMKIDDDVVFNTPYVINYLHEQSKRNLSNSFLCRAMYHKIVKRDPSRKFWLSKKYYYPDEYPTYCDGPAYMFTADIATPFFVKSFSVRRFTYEDVYVSGLLAARLNSSFVDLFKYYNRAHFFYSNWTNITYDQSMFIFTNTPHEYGFMWNRVLANFKRTYLQ